MPTPVIEYHPLAPFLPPKASVLLLGSFPPKRERWSMDFFYPNFQNDMWRILGWLFLGDKHAFITPGKKAFDREPIKRFCQEQGLALFDTATAVRRLKDNASDLFLEVVQPTDLSALLHTLPDCRFIAATGEKAAQLIAKSYHVTAPPVGAYLEFPFEERTIRFYRLPSSSRAYPLALEKKAESYRLLFQDAGLL